MLQDLDKTLEELLKQNLPSDLARQISFSFDTPDRESISKTPAINFFLYDIRENLELRSNVNIFERPDDGPALKRRPPARVDCSYIVTAWPTKPSDPEQEHQLLGAVMAVLLRYRKLPANILQGSLVGQQPPVRAKALRPSQLQSLGEFWQAIGGKPKATLNYTITLAIAVHDEIEKIPVITEREISLGIGTPPKELERKIAKPQIL
ncbi:MAG: DUF4255 domain-containing protein [Phormidesmis priestleyi]|uniref:DUF4255 domain-containing protein n=1 Tax=Phormidesmis priestleyi TaxID=268141 RepID=A0A2W4X9K5_9CYAN|nr:MAG: DUF4255 domain-containing protein [Phormidesmis priestleyi]